ncbi:basic amino acid/polyamine antiporter [Acidocella aminolytica]|nr:basic amino acid/polyamine antiporter [Acidocella aminolytica]GBQ40828.1 amino acid transporter [Acidocella aminolytica 101 = DSM 11237]SHF26296.1 amino acid/polyamine/organocation transporter, APC superfamily [Acidocella aminolytica 101 = DSM 11237]
MNDVVQPGGRSGPPPARTETAQPGTRAVGLFSLLGMVVGSMIGGGVFNLPQNMAAGAGLGAIVIAWIITGVGMYFLANTFRTLADKRPDLTAGIYTYAREGFGRYAGFNSAWGYWLSSAFGNVGFAVLVMQTLGFFFPSLISGKSWEAILGGSILIWGMYFVVLAGVKQAAFLNAVATATKIVPIIALIVILAVFLNSASFTTDIWGRVGHLGNILTQVKSTMMVTLWVFIGIEGAVVVSGRARKTEDVGRATFLGLLICLLLYVLVSVLPFGVMSQKELAALNGPSAAYVLQHIVGHWGAIFMILSVLVSLLSCWLAWTILVAELPFEGAKDGVFPKFLARENSSHSPAPSLLLSTIVMQVSMFVVVFANNAWLWMVAITGVMILPAYFASTAFLFRYAGNPTFVTAHGTESKTAALLSGMLGSVYAVWLLYAAGLQFVLLSTIVYAIGIPFYWYAQKEQGRAAAAFNSREAVAAFILVAAAVISAILIGNGTVSIG